MSIRGMNRSNRQFQGMQDYNARIQMLAHDKNKVKGAINGRP